MKWLRFAAIKSLFLLACAGAAWGQAPQPAPAISRGGKQRLPPGFHAQSIKLDENGTEYKYAMFIPPQYKMNPDHRWPLILFLHDSGECGDDGVRQTTVGLPVYISLRATQFPFLVLMPQAHFMWFRGNEALAVWRMLDQTMKQFRVDEDRVYITGISMGGVAAWELPMARPDFFAATVPIGGAAPKEYRDYLCNLSTIPIWAFHGAQDANAPAAASRDAINELRRIGGVGPKYTEYFDLGHQCWDKAYAEPDLWRWLRAQRRRIPKTITYRLPDGGSKLWWLDVKAQSGLAAPANIRAEINDANQVNVESDGVESWGLYSDKEPLRPGTDIQVNWNGAVVFRGKFNGSLAFKPEDAPEKPPLSTTAPAAGGAGGDLCAVNDSSGGGAAAGMKPTILASDHILGSASAKVTVVAYTDFQCPACGLFARSVYPTIKADFIDTGKVRWVFRHFPMPGNRRAEPAARASECANDQGAFFSYAERTFATISGGTNTILTDQQLQQNAAAIGLDIVTFNACFPPADDMAGRVQQNVHSGMVLGVTATPTFFINDLCVPGFQSYDRMTELINQKLGNQTASSRGQSPTAPRPAASGG